MTPESIHTVIAIIFAIAGAGIGVGIAKATQAVHSKRIEALEASREREREDSERLREELRTTREELIERLHKLDRSFAEFRGQVRGSTGTTDKRPVVPVDDDVSGPHKG